MWDEQRESNPLFIEYVDQGFQLHFSNTLLDIHLPAPMLVIDS